MTRLRRKKHGIVTPNGLIFERHHAGIPDIDPATHRLVIHGMVKQPLVFSMDNLLRLFFESEEVRRLLRKRFAPDPPNRVFVCVKRESYASAQFNLN